MRVVALKYLLRLTTGMTPEACGSDTDELQLTVLGARAIASRTESVIPLCRTMAEYKLAVDSSKKATELPLLRVGGTVQQNPHMRAFWASTISFFLAFLGRFVRIYYSSAILSLSC